MGDARVKAREEQGESVLAAVPGRMGLSGFIPSPPSLSCHEMWDSWAGVVAVLGVGAESRVGREKKIEQEQERECAHVGMGVQESTGAGADGHRKAAQQESSAAKSSAASQ